MLKEARKQSLHFFLIFLLTSSSFLFFTFFFIISLSIYPTEIRDRITHKKKPPLSHQCSRRRGQGLFCFVFFLTLLGLEGKAVAELVGVLIKVPGVNQDSKGGLGIGADLVDVGESDLASGVKLGLEAGVDVKLVLGAELNGGGLVAGGPGGQGGEGHLAVDGVAELGLVLGEPLVGVHGDGVVILGVTNGSAVVAEVRVGHVKDGLGSDNEALVANNGIDLNLGLLEDVGGEGGGQVVILEGGSSLDLLGNLVGVEGGLELDLGAGDDLGGLDLEDEVVGGGHGVVEDQARGIVLVLGLDLSLDVAVGVVALNGVGELLQKEQKEGKSQNE